MKILFLQKLSGIAGSERYLLNILPEIKDRGLDVSFLVLQHPKSSKKNHHFISTLKAANIPVFVLNSFFPLSLGLIMKAYLLIKKENFNILHSNLIHADFLAAILKRFFSLPIKIISTKHGYSEKFQSKHSFDYTKLKPDLFFLISKWAAQYADQVVCISKSLENFYQNSKIVRNTKVITIPYGFDFPQLSAPSSGHQFKFGSPQIIVTGRLEPVKQHHMLLNILPDLKSIFPNLSVVMVGGGSLMKQLNTLSSQLEVSKYVHWTGFQDNVHHYIDNSDLMIIPSRSEGFGLVILEAWHHAKPVIGFDVPALNDIIETGRDGILVEPFSSQGLLDASIELLSDASKMRRYGDAGQKKQKDIFGMDSMISETIRVLQSLVKGSNDIQVGPS
jgi:glycosyltransferase involved in cell wall biosynthesis